MMVTASAMDSPYPIRMPGHVPREAGVGGNSSRRRAAAGEYVLQSEAFPVRIDGFCFGSGTGAAGAALPALCACSASRRRRPVTELCSP